MDPMSSGNGGSPVGWPQDPLQETAAQPYASAQSAQCENERWTPCPAEKPVLSDERRMEAGIDFSPGRRVIGAIEYLLDLRLLFMISSYEDFVNRIAMLCVK
jgi:hypothetical protein